MNHGIWYTALGAVALAVMCFPVLAARDTTIDDDFCEFDESVWEVGTNVGGQARVESCTLVVRSDTQYGGGTWVQTLQQYTPDAYGTLYLRTQCVLDSVASGEWDPALWGLFSSISQQRYIAFIFNPQVSPYLRAAVRDGDDMIDVEMPDASVFQWADYQISIMSGEARFYVNGELKETIASDIVPSEYPLHVRFDKGSPGWNTFLRVDDILLTDDGPTPRTMVSWGSIKARFQRAAEK